MPGEPSIPPHIKNSLALRIAGIVAVALLGAASVPLALSGTISGELSAGLLTGATSAVIALVRGSSGTWTAALPIVATAGGGALAALTL